MLDAVAHSKGANGRFDALGLVDILTKRAETSKAKQIYRIGVNLGEVLIEG